MILRDKNGNNVESGSVIDLGQTVNGQNLFVVLTISPIDVRYGHDLNRKYEYDIDELFRHCKYSGEVDFEIVSNIYDLILSRSQKLEK